MSRDKRTIVVQVQLEITKKDPAWIELRKRVQRIAHGVSGFKYMTHVSNANPDPLSGLPQTGLE